MTKKIGIIIQARTGSTRLPNKVVLPFHQETSILEILIQKLLVFKDRYTIVLATTDAENDRILVDVAKTFGIEYYQGDQLNVLQRFVDAATEFNVETIVRICSDNPFLDIGFIQKMIDYFKNYPGLDYLSYRNGQGIPAIKTHLGLFAEMITVDALKRVQQYTDEKLYQEHVTNYIYSNPSKFKLDLLDMPDYLIGRDDLRFTIDDPKDFTNLGKVYSYYRDNKSDIQAMIDYLDKDSHALKLMNSNIKKYEK